VMCTMAIIMHHSCSHGEYITAKVLRLRKHPTEPSCRCVPHEPCARPMTSGHRLRSGAIFCIPLYDSYNYSRQIIVKGHGMSHFLKQIALAALLTLIGASIAFASTGYLTIPPGTALTVRMNEHLNSEETKPGDSFHGVLASAVIVNGKKVVPKGAEVVGEVIKVERSGRLSNLGELQLALGTIQFGGRRYNVGTQTLVIKGESHAKSN